jgi:hypothetical protein
MRSLAASNSPRLENQTHDCHDCSDAKRDWRTDEVDDDREQQDGKYQYHRILEHSGHRVQIARSCAGLTIFWQQARLRCRWRCDRLAGSVRVTFSNCGGVHGGSSFGIARYP